MAGLRLTIAPSASREPACESLAKGSQVAEERPAPALLLANRYR
jgi:hypothetical protein